VLTLIDVGKFACPLATVRLVLPKDTAYLGQFPANRFSS
jgi:hypothetical protein